MQSVFWCLWIVLISSSSLEWKWILSDEGSLLMVDHRGLNGDGGIWVSVCTEGGTSA